jgi:hypothetical protein
MATIEEQLQENQLSARRPIAGESLTNNPEARMPFEKAPKFSNVHEATEFLWVKMIEETTYVTLMQKLADGMPVMDIAQLLVRGGFQEGLWNPDLMMLLLEPVAYMLIALAERLDIELVIHRGELNDAVDSEMITSTKAEEMKARNLIKASETGIIPDGVISQDMQRQLEEADLPEEDSLLAPPQEEGIESPQQESLLAPSQNQG